MGGGLCVYICKCVCAELQSFGGIPSRFSNPAQIQPSCQMDSCAEFNLTLLGLDDSSGENPAFKGAAREKKTLELCCLD